MKVVKLPGRTSKATAKGVAQDPDKVESSTRMPMLGDVGHVRLLSGELIYYRAFLPSVTTLIRPLNNLLRKGVKFLFSPDRVGL